MQLEVFQNVSRCTLTLQLWGGICDGEKRGTYNSHVSSPTLLQLRMSYRVPDNKFLRNFEVTLVVHNSVCQGSSRKRRRISVKAPARSRQVLSAHPEVPPWQVGCHFWRL